MTFTLRPSISLPQPPADQFKNVRSLTATEVLRLQILYNQMLSSQFTPLVKFDGQKSLHR